MSGGAQRLGVMKQLGQDALNSKSPSKAPQKEAPQCRSADLSATSGFSLLA